MPRPKKERRGEKPKWRSRANTWVARVWEADGSCSGWVDLGTNNRELAHETYERWLLTGERPESDRGKESFGKAAERIIDQAAKDGDITPKLAQDRRTRLRKYALPSLGHLEVARILPHHIASVLDGMSRSHEKGAGTLLKLRSDISQILGQLRREGAVEVNHARGAELPKRARRDTRERVRMTDAQLLRFQAVRGCTRPLDLMVLFARCVGGHRTSDVHAARWEEIDLIHFATMKVRRPKTDEDVGRAIRSAGRRPRAYEKVDHVVDESYRGAIRAYWEAQGSPSRGPVFPLLRDGVGAPMRLKDGRVVERKASRAGGAKNQGTSYAKALRRAVWEAGIYSPMAAGTRLVDGTELEAGFDPEHPDPSRCFFQTDTATTRRLDFHGFRTDLNTALYEADATERTLLDVMGHTQTSTGRKHYSGRRQVRVPKAALPGGGQLPETLTKARVEEGFLPGAGRKPRSVASQGHRQVSDIARVPEPNRTVDQCFRNASEGASGPVTARKVDSDDSARDPVAGGKIPASGRIGRKPSPEATPPDIDPRAQLLETAANAVRQGDWALADQIRKLLDALPLATVHELSVARTRLR